MSLSIPIIPSTKNYWLVRTQGGKYYNEFRRSGFIAVNWDKISLEEINTLDPKELTVRVKKDYPDKPNPGRTANQLRIFTNNIKKGDAIIITGVASNKLSIGEVLADEPYEATLKAETLLGNDKLCPFQKRKKIRWIKELHKYEVEMELFKLLQHAQHTITEADDYADLIEGLIHTYFIRGDRAQLILEVKKRDKIPMLAFFPMGTEILELAKDYNQFSNLIKLDLEGIDTKININSPGKITLSGTMWTITILGMLIVGVAGGDYEVKFPVVGGSIHIKTNSILKEVSDFLDQRKANAQKDLLLKTYMDDLDVKTPDDLLILLKSIDEPEVIEVLKAIPEDKNVLLENKDNTSENK